MVGRPRAPLPLNTSRPLDPFPLKQVTERVRDELTVTRVAQFDIVSAPHYEIRTRWGTASLRASKSTRDLLLGLRMDESGRLPGNSPMFDHMRGSGPAG